MKNIWILFILTAAVLIAAPFCSGNDNPKILIKTELGDITVEIFAEKAPITALNFLN